MRLKDELFLQIASLTNTMVIIKCDLVDLFDKSQMIDY